MEKANIPRKFYMQKFTVTVLSEEPIDPDLDLRDIINEAETGSFIASYNEGTVKELNKSQAKRILIQMGSDPEFFGIESQHG